MTVEQEVRPGESPRTLAVAFRDPPSPRTTAAELQLEIARVLVRAPELPIELPRFGLTLLGVEANGSAIDLLIGTGSPLAKLRVSAPNAVNVMETRPEAIRFRRALRVMAERVGAATSETKWRSARALALKLRQVPVDVPLGFFRQLVAGVDPPQALVRTGFGCNQDCGLCWQGREWGRFDAAQVIAWIEDLHAAGARRLILSGGEPTLDAALGTYIARARELGYVDVTLETNAIAFARAGKAEELRDAGLTDCFVSLHSGSAEVSDAITRAPGTFVRTISGIRRLLECGIPVGLNCVLTHEGLEHLESLPDFIHHTFGPHPLLTGLMLSSPTDPFDRALLPSIIPDPAKLRRVLPAVLDRAFELGIVVRGLDGPCGPPLCHFGADRRVVSLAPVPEPVEFRVHLPACERCAVRHACFGVRDAQVAIYGESCVAPFTEMPHTV